MNHLRSIMGLIVVLFLAVSADAANGKAKHDSRKPSSQGNCNPEIEKAGRKKIEKHVDDIYDCGSSFVGNTKKDRPYYFVVCTDKKGYQHTAQVILESEGSCDIHDTNYEGRTRSVDGNPD